MKLKQLFQPLGVVTEAPANADALRAGGQVGLILRGEQGWER